MIPTFPVVSGGVSTLGSTLIGSSKSDGDATINIIIGSITTAAIAISIYYITLYCILPYHFYYANPRLWKYY